MEGKQMSGKGMDSELNRKDWMKRALEAAKTMDCQDAEAFYVYRDGFSVSALNGEIERYSVSNTGGVGLRVQRDGRDGYAYTEAVTAPEQTVARALDNARCIEQSDAQPMQGKQTYQQVQMAQCPMEAMEPEEKIALALELERATLAVDTRVQKVVACCVQSGRGGVMIQNTRGLDAARESVSGFCYVEPLVAEGGQVQTGFAFRMGAEAADVAGCAKEAVADALSKLGGVPVPTGSYRVIIQNMTMAELLTGFSSMFSAEQAQKGCSLLADKEGEIIGAERVTLLDDPFDPVAPRAFDDEGTACKTKAIIENGRFITLLHNLKTAAKAGTVSTGNGERASAGAPISVGPSVLRLLPGTEPFEALVKRMGDGLIITELQGLHAGLNPVSGDFSLKASGRRVKNGVDVGPVSGITLAGNMLILLKSVTCLGNDARFTLPGSCYASAPSVLVDGLQVAGS